MGMEESKVLTLILPCVYCEEQEEEEEEVGDGGGGGRGGGEKSL